MADSVVLVAQERRGHGSRGRHRGDHSGPCAGRSVGRRAPPHRVDLLDRVALAGVTRSGRQRDHDAVGGAVAQNELVGEKRRVVRRVSDRGDRLNGEFRYSAGWLFDCSW